MILIFFFLRLGITIKFMLLVAFYWMLIFADPDQCFGYNFCIFLADCKYHFLEVHFHAHLLFFSTFLFYSFLVSFHQNRPLFGYMILISISIIVAVIYDGCMVEGVMKVSKFKDGAQFLIKSYFLFLQRESKYLKEGMECRAAELLVSLIFILLFASFSLTSWLFIIPCVTIQIYAILVIDSMRVILVKEENMNVTLQVV